MTNASDITHATKAELEAGQGAVADCPQTGGTVELIVSRPTVDQREVCATAQFVVGEGMVGDNYTDRGDGRGGPPHPQAQVTLMNSKSVDLVTRGDEDRWPLAGDQLFVDLDLSVSNLPTGTRLSIGSAVLEVTAKPHNGCAKFAQRFGIDAGRWVNSSKEHRYRGINAAVVTSGTVSVGDTINKL